MRPAAKPRQYPASRSPMRNVSATEAIIASAIGAGIGYGIAAAALELFEIEFLRANLVLSFGAMVGLLLGGAQAVALMRSGALVVEAR